MTDSQPKKRRKRPYLEIVGEVLEGAIPLATAIVQMRNRPRTLDYLALSVASINAIVKGKRAYDQLTTPTSQTFFSEKDATGEFIWAECPEFLAPFLFSCVKEAQEVVSSNSGQTPSVFAGMVGDEVVSWEEVPRRWGGRSTQPLEVPPLYVKHTRRHHVYDELHRCLWRDAGGRHVQATELFKFTAVSEDPGDVFITPDITRLLDRVQRFYATDQARSYLLEGPPGTGKTTAIRYVATMMGLRTLRIRASHLPDRDRFAVFASQRTIDPMDLLRVAKPDMLILDDVDQVDDHASFLEFISDCRRHCKIVLGSANNKHRLGGAALRAGRFDDHLEFHKLPTEVIEKLLGPDYAHLATQLESWPIAYITDFMHKVTVLGEEAALRETAEIRKRIEEIDKSIENSSGSSDHRRRRHQ